jgi:hypothetical protein
MSQLLVPLPPPPETVSGQVLQPLQLVTLDVVQLAASVVVDEVELVGDGAFVDLVAR